MERREVLSCWVVVVAKKSDTTLASDILKYKVLLVKHVNGGHWSFPKWHQEVGETDIQTAKRELLEETWIDNIVLFSEKTANSYYEFERGEVYICKTVRYFLGLVPELFEVVLQDGEVLDWGWFDWDEANEIIGQRKFSPEADKRLLEIMKNYVFEL